MCSINDPDCAQKRTVSSYFDGLPAGRHLRFAIAHTAATGAVWAELKTCMFPFRQLPSDWSLPAPPTKHRHVLVSAAQARGSGKSPQEGKRSSAKPKPGNRQKQHVVQPQQRQPQPEAKQSKQESKQLAKAAQNVTQPQPSVRQASQLPVTPHAERRLASDTEVVTLSQTTWNSPAWSAVTWAARLCDSVEAAYMLRGVAAAMAQGVDVHSLLVAEVSPGSAGSINECEAFPLECEVQWDQVEALHAAASRNHAGIMPVSKIQPHPGGASFTVQLSQADLPSDPPVQVWFTAQSATVLAADAARVQVACVPGEPGDDGHTSSGAAQSISNSVSQGAQRPQPAMTHLWCESLISLRTTSQRAGCTDKHSPALATLSHAITARLAELQARLSRQNLQPWSDTYSVWVTRFGAPAEAAAWVASDPITRVGHHLTRHLLPALTPGSRARSLAQPRADVDHGQGADSSLAGSALSHTPLPLSGVRILNLLGSHGVKAVALALLGAQVTVVDFSTGNAQYAKELAAAAGVSDRLTYITADVLHLHSDPAAQALWGTQDWVVSENGVLHFFLDLQAFFSVCQRALAPGQGRLLLHDFHPVSTKLITTTGKKHAVKPNYFSTSLSTTAAAVSKRAQYSQQGGDGDAEGRHAGAADGDSSVRLRQWTLGEIVTEAVAAGLSVTELLEEQGPRGLDAGIPKTFTLVCGVPVKAAG